MFTYKNHLQFLIDDLPFAARDNCYQKYKVIYGSPDRNIIQESSWDLENRKIVHLTRQVVGDEINIFFSGGTDSEIVVRYFLAEGFKPELYFIKFADSSNTHELVFAKSIADELNLQLNILDLDINDFFNSGEALVYAARTQCSQIGYLAMFYFVEKMQKPFILGGEVFLNRLKDKWVISFSENTDAAFMRFSKDINIPIIHEWFSYTPEIMYYFLTHEKMQSVLKNPMLSLSTYSKNSVLKALCPDISLRSKATSFKHSFIANSFYHFSLQNQIKIDATQSLNGVLLEEFII